MLDLDQSMANKRQLETLWRCGRKYVPLLSRCSDECGTSPDEVWRPILPSSCHAFYSLGNLQQIITNEYAVIQDISQVHVCRWGNNTLCGVLKIIAPWHRYRFMIAHSIKDAHCSSE
jgi:hypothetical protein